LNFHIAGHGLRYRTTRAPLHKSYFKNGK